MNLERVVLKNKRIIILGAGPCGLATAYGLVNKGYKVEIYEDREVVGGLGGSEKIDGMVFDYGPHIYHTHDESMKTFWRENFGDLLIEKEFFSKNHKDGVLYDYPLSYDNIEKFPKKIKDKVKKELSEINPENIMRAQNFKEVVTAIVGPTLQDIFFETYSKKLWGIPTTEMSAKWAPKRIEIRRNHKSFWFNQYSAAGKYGSGAIMNRIADIIREKGGEIHLNSKVTGLKAKNGKIEGVEINEKYFVDTINSIIISTLPITVTSNFLGYKSKLEFNSYILAYAIVNTDELLPENVQSIYFAHDDNYFHRVTEQKKYSDIGYPEDKTLLCFELSYRIRPHLAEIDGEELAKTCYEQLCDTGFGKKEDFIKGFKRTFPCINPIMRIGFEDELSKSNSVISKYKNLHTVGGSAEFSYGDMQVMFAKANDLVELLSSEHYKINRNLKVGAPFKFNELVKIGDYNVGGDNPTLIIAEIGINHQGSNDMAMELIKEAKLSGCEYAKIQTYDADNRVSAIAKSAKYADKTLSMEETTHEMFKRLELDEKDHELLFNYAKKINMPLISTPFDERSVDLLMNYDIDAFKVASFDIVNLSLIKYIASKHKPIILSTGMCSMSEIEDALDTIATQECNNVILLHCVSSYPAEPEDVNLKAINSMKSAFKVPVGYSDHTIGLVVPLAAVAMNADVLEKHLTLNISYEGSDHILSSTPDEMKKIVDARDTIYSAFGTGIKRPRAVENVSVNLQRKSIFSTKPIKKGQKLSLDNITIKGPGHGLLPKYIELILGKKINKNIESDQPITWDELLF